MGKEKKYEYQQSQAEFYTTSTKTKHQWNTAGQQYTCRYIQSDHDKIVYGVHCSINQQEKKNAKSLQTETAMDGITSTSAVWGFVWLVGLIG
eukprot:m.41807 g.41807  ORF g.41807 m.41807 type:complete len:92 (+) comp11860_c0_seq2:33-308(+)